MLLMIDNYDSFTYNLVHYFEELGETVEVFHNDKITINEIKSMQPKQIVLSPGPGNPNDAGICLEILKSLSKKIPTFGVCLGHQCIAEVFHSKVVHAKKVMHGKRSQIQHDGSGIFSQLPQSFHATRYHSLIVDTDSLDPSLQITAWTEDDEIMGIKHRDYPIQGVQFHPESILSEHGLQLLENFIAH